MPDHDALATPQSHTQVIPLDGAFQLGALPAGTSATVARALFEQSPFSTVLYDIEGHILDFNAAFERLFGLTKETVPADYCVLTDPQLERGGHLATVRRAFEGEVVALPLVFYDASALDGAGRRSWTQGHFFPMRDLAGAVTGVVLIHVELTERVEAEEARRLSEERLRIALDAGRMGAWEWDIAGGRVHWSDMLQRIHGLVPGTFGGTFEEYQSDMHPDDRERVLAQIARSLEGGAHHVEYRIIWPTGEVRWLEARGELFRTADGSPARMLGICTDITERRLAEQERDAAQQRLEEQAGELEMQTEQLQAQAAEMEAQRAELERQTEELHVANDELLRSNEELVAAREVAVRAQEEAEGANRAKGQFLTTMSHELRTPLNAIGGYAQLIEMEIHGPVTTAQREALRRVQRSQEHLLSLINDVLNFAKLEAGRVTYHIEHVPVRELIGGLDSLVAPQLTAKSLQFACVPCDATLAIAADVEKAQQILLNLLSNAIKFTPAGGEIRVEARGEGEWIHIGVVDTGIGIPTSRAEVVFEPFVQLARGTSSTGDGTGLGLAISRDLARAMGGDLTLESGSGQGSIFTLTLPRSAAPIDRTPSEVPD